MEWIKIPYRAAWRLVMDDKGLELSGYIAFTAFLSLFPFLIFLAALAGFLGDRESADGFIEAMFHYTHRTRCRRLKWNIASMNPSADLRSPTSRQGGQEDQEREQRRNAGNAMQPESSRPSSSHDQALGGAVGDLDRLHGRGSSSGPAGVAGGGPLLSGRKRPLAASLRGQALTRRRVLRTRADSARSRRSHL